ncbi:MAG: pyridoxal-phosphate dependent enzyme, partial [Actinobacteria bacterium]|nr:pyridoxal-phosphate dependent enzyme [Actinomycetota bacterium]
MADPRPPDTATRSVPPIVYADVEAAANRLQGVANHTPVLASRTVDERVGGRVFFKCENFQRMGAFKFRGAYNAMSRLSEEQKRTGVLAYSSGNHAQAVALAGQLLGIQTTIVMPTDAPAVKLAATRGYGAEVVEYDRSETTREELGAGISRKRGLSIIPPYDHPDVIAGQGTTAKELFEEVGALDLLLVCCGGGGLLSGCAIAARALSPGCRVVGVEPERADDATRSFRTGTLQK